MKLYNISTAKVYPYGVNAAQEYGWSQCQRGCEEVQPEEKRGKQCVRQQGVGPTPVPVQRVYFPWTRLGKHRYAINIMNKKAAVSKAVFWDTKASLMLRRQNKTSSHALALGLICKSKRVTCGQVGAWKNTTASQPCHQKGIYCFTTSIKVIPFMPLVGKVTKSV